MRKQLYFSIFALFISITFGQLLFSQKVERNTKEKKAEINNLLSKLYNSKQFNGNVLIAEDGDVIFEKAFGYADIEKGTKLELNSCYQLASVSKQFTAVSILILKEKGKLSIEDSLTKFFPDLPYYKIKIRHLLTHTSGLPDYLSLFRAKWDTANHDLKDRKIAVNDDVIKMLTLHKPDVLFAPGEKYEYSNTGYLLLASIIEKVSGEEFDKFLEKNIFKPLKMKNTLLYSNIKKQPITNRAIGYQLSWDGETPLVSDIGYLDGTCGDKGIYSNTEDLYKWDRALYKEKIIKQKTLKEAFTRKKLNNDSTIRYGFGWFVDTTEGKAEVWHTGTWFGFRNRFLRQIDENNTIILLSNNTITPRTEIVFALSDILHNREYKTPKMPLGLPLGKVLKDEGIDSMIKKYYDLKDKSKDLYSFEESELNSFGYKLLRNKKVKESLGVFLLNSKEFPNSSNVYDSLGEAFIADGNKEQAIINFAKSLTLNPKNISAVDRIVQLTNEFRK